MLKDFEKSIPEEKDVLNREIRELRARLIGQQQLLREKKLPVMVLIEGWAAAGKGSLINQLISEIDPRFYNVVSPAVIPESEARYPFLYPYATAIPENGKLTFLDSGWMESAVRKILRLEISKKEYRRRIRSVMGIAFLEGRAPRDSSEMVVDEKFVARMADFTDWSDGAVGKQIAITGHERSQNYYTISGVYKSYLLGNLAHVDRRPSVLFYGEMGSMNSWMPHVMFKVQPEALPKAREALENALEGREINILSYEEEMRAAYADSKKMRNTMAIGAVFSLLIALLGLIGFIKDESLRRSKEMAVRKINGATTRDILGVFAKDIMKLSIAAALLACIGAFFVARRWLEQFAEKVSLNPLYFIGGAALVLLIVLGVVVLNCLRIAQANPVESLKNE